MLYEEMAPQMFFRQKRVLDDIMMSKDSSKLLFKWKL